MKEKFGQFKEAVGKLGSKTKKLIIAGAVILIIGAVAIAFVMNNQPYEVLFSGLGVEEAQQIIGRLQEDGVEFKYDNDSTIRVKKDMLDVTKAKLVQEGYPKSGFTYDTFKNNAGMMTTDSDKKTYKLYELQDRIGSTIRLFDGVKDAKVTIALGEESKYALDDAAKKRTSATAVITMKDGGSPTEEQAAAIQRLVAKSVPEMEMTDVAVFDGNGNDVSTEAQKTANGSDAEEIAQIVEDQIANKVMKVLGPIYGDKNVKVSARAQVNMEALIREQTTYTTPEKINEEDKTGIISREELYNENSVNGNGAQGVAGAETNADTAEYNTNGNVNGAQAASESITRDYLVNQLKEQGQIAPGALEDLTVSVAINGNGYGSLREAQLRSLIGNASGIPTEEQATKITVASAPFYEEEVPEEEEIPVDGMLQVKPVQLIVAGAALLVLIIALIVILVLRKKRKRRLAEEAELAELAAVPDYEPVLDLNKEIMEMKNDRGMELKKNIRDFADQNPEISAQLLKSWLNGGKDGE